MQLRAVCYTRVSTLEQASEDKVSIEDQTKWAEEFSRERKWLYVGSYSDKGVRGDVEPEERLGFSQLLKDAREDRFDIVLVFHSSRLAREADLGLRACRLLGMLRKQIFLRNSPIEPVNPHEFYWGSNVGSLFMSAFSFVGDMGENVARSERVRSGALGLAKRGILKSAPYGYVKVPTIITDEQGRQKYHWRFDQDPVKASVVLEIFDKYANTGGSIRSIVLDLNKNNIPAPSGKIGSEAWASATVKNILNNVAYIGQVRYGRKLGSKYKEGKSITGKSKRIIAPPEKWILTKGENFTGFIDPALFQKCQEKLKARSIIKGRAVASPGLLAGILYCGHCQRRAYHKTRLLIKKKYNKEYIHSDYVCSSWIRYKTCNRHIIAAKKIHQNIINVINEVAGNNDYKKLILEEYRPREKFNAEDIERVKKLIESIEVKQTRVLDAYEGGVIDLETFSKRKKVLDKDLIEAKTRLHELSDTVRAEEQYQKGIDRFSKHIEEFKDGFENYNFNQRKELLTRLIERVTVVDGDAHVVFRI